MENNNTLRRIHPLVAGAAVSVMLVSLTGVAAMTGLISNSHGTTAPAPVASSIGAAAAAASPAALVEAKTDEPAPSVATPAPSAPQYAPRPVADAQVRMAAPVHHAAVCSTCGTIESIHAIRHAAQPSGVGVVAGALVGGLLGNQVGGGSGRTLATVAGAVGGGYAGNEVEKRSHTTVSYQVRVRMENGRSRTFNYQQQPSWSVGEHVRVVNGHLSSRA